MTIENHTHSILLIDLIRGMGIRHNNTMHIVNTLSQDPAFGKPILQEYIVKSGGGAQRLSMTYVLTPEQAHILLSRLQSNLGMKKTRDTMKSVYLLEANGLYKIGSSINVESRRKKIQTTSPYFVTLVNVIYYGGEGRNIELFLHRQFQTRQLMGEWFALTASDIAEIPMLIEMYFELE